MKHFVTFKMAVTSHCNGAVTVESGNRLNRASEFYR
jgi:hypothetical protein